MSDSFDFDSFYSDDSDPFDDDGQYVDTQNLIAENAEFGNWLFQLQEACTADRLEDIEAIASMQCPKQVVLRRFTRYGPPPIENDQDSFLSNKSTRLEHRDELLPIAAMYEQENCPPLPDFPPADSEAGIKLKEILLRPSGGFGGHCLFWVQSVEALKILEAQGASTHDRWGDLPLLVHMAENRHLGIVRFLVDEQQHDPNVARQDGLYTALHWAKDIAIVRFLIERGGDLNALTSFGDSVLAQQLRYGQAEVVDLLLGMPEEEASRANLLHWLNANPEILRVLLKHRIPLDQPLAPTGYIGWFPSLAMQSVLDEGLVEWLHAKSNMADKAVTAKNVLECVDILLAQGWDASRRDGAGRLPYHVVQDWLPDTNEPLRRALDERLAKYDGERVKMEQMEDE